MDISSVDLQKEIGKLLEDYGEKINVVINEEAENISKEARKRLAKESRQFSGKKYRSGWRVKSERMFGGMFVRFTLYNSTRASLTHLLEKGHPIKRGGVTVGQARAFPHISTVNDWVLEEFPRRVTEKINTLGKE